MGLGLFPSSGDLIQIINIPSKCTIKILLSIEIMYLLNEYLVDAFHVLGAGTADLALSE